MSLSMRTSLGLLAILAAMGALALLAPVADAADRPSGLRARTDGTDVFLTWTPVDADSQVIIRRAAGTATGDRGGGDSPDFQPAPWLEVDTLSADADSWTDTDVDAGRRYLYRVKAVRDNRADKTSAKVQVKVRVKHVPPTGLTATVATSDVILSWTAGTNPKYTDQIVLRRQRGAAWEELTRLGNATTTTYTDATAQSGQRYIYRVKAIQDNGRGGVSRKAVVSVP